MVFEPPVVVLPPTPKPAPKPVCVKPLVYRPRYPTNPYKNKYGDYFLSEAEISSIRRQLDQQSGPQTRRLILNQWNYEKKNALLGVSGQNDDLRVVRKYFEDQINDHSSEIYKYRTTLSQN